MYRHCHNRPVRRHYPAPGFGLRYHTGHAFAAAEPESGIGTARALVRLVDMIKRLGVPEKDIRIGKRQVHGAAGTARKGQTNKPDISFPRKGRRYNIEIDTNPNQSVKHQNDIIHNRTKDRTYFLMIDKQTGRIKSARVYPGKGTTTQPLKRFRLHESEYESLREW